MNNPVDKVRRDFLPLQFGMFMHFNLTTFLDRGWPAGYHDPSFFNPGSRIDTDAWADAAVTAGMTYGVLTTKHASGFCLWDSKYTTYDVMNPNCPYQYDVVAQFVESFLSRGLKVGLYYCWRNPGFGDPEKHKVLPPECDPATHSFDEQNEFQMQQIAELLEKFPDVFYLWNDGIDPEVMPATELLEFIESVRSGVLASANWWDWSKKGTPYLDIAVTETKHFPEDNTFSGETCWQLEDHWFWGEGAGPKKASDIVEELQIANNRNANFLLNVGPDRNGNIIPASRKVLAEIGTLRGTG